MKEATAQLNNLRMSPRKVRLVANYMRGKRADELLSSLKFVPKAAGKPLQKLLESALANARNLEIDTANLYVSNITVNSGAILYRQLPTARGRAFRLRKRTSKIVLTLGEKKGKGKKSEKKTQIKKNTK